MLTAEQFTSYIAQQVRQGASLAPFVGSGLSAPSGILTGREFTDYLAYAVFRSVADYTDPSALLTHTPLNIRESGWPEMPSKKDVEHTRLWISSALKHHCEEHLYDIVRDEQDHSKINAIQPKSPILTDSFYIEVCRIPQILAGTQSWVFDEKVVAARRRYRHSLVSTNFGIDPSVSPRSPGYVREAALRSLADWRDTLHFLACLCKTPGQPPRLTSPERYIIDSFNVFVTKERRPNFGHAMLAQLVSAARIRTIFTTNFENLLEIVLTECGENFRPIQIGTSGKLPDASFVRSTNCILKLHGESNETRADHSLDSPPSEVDLETFASYLARSFGSGRSQRPVHLMVCGSSGRDIRTIQLFKHALCLIPDLKIFWVCHSPSEEAYVSSIFRRDGFSIASNSAELPSARLVVTSNPRTDLLLAELYERLTLSLPRKSIGYPFVQNAPPVPYRENTEEENHHFDAGLANQICRAYDRGMNLIVVDGSSGVQRQMSIAFEQIRRNRVNVLWHDLAEYGSAAALVHDILLQIAIRSGRYQREHARLYESKASPDSIAKLLKELFEHWGFDPGNWVVFLYARDGYGGSAGWSGELWSDQELHKLHSLLGQVANPKIDGTGAGRALRIVYAPYSTTRREICDRHAALRKAQWLDNRELHPIPPVNLEGVVWARHGVPLDKQEFGEGDYTWICPFWPRSTAPGTNEPNTERNLAALKNVYGSETGIHNLTEAEVESSGLEILDRDVTARARALYSASLMRRARHISVLMSDRTFECRHQFNSRGFDNDWDRWTRVDSFLKYDWSFWENARAGSSPTALCALLAKPGGFLWMYRDGRAEITDMVERRGRYIKWVTRKEWRPEIFGLSQRARLHQSIAEWNLRAFRATGHAEPLEECLFHYWQAIRHSCVASAPRVFKSVRSYRLSIARRSLYGILKVLRSSRFRARWWVQGFAGDSWFSAEDAGVQRFIEELSICLKGIWPSEYEHWVECVKGELAFHASSVELRLHAISEPLPPTLFNLGKDSVSFPLSLPRPPEELDYRDGVAWWRFWTQSIRNLTGSVTDRLLLKVVGSFTHSLSAFERAWETSNGEDRRHSERALQKLVKDLINKLIAIDVPSCVLQALLAGVARWLYRLADNLRFRAKRIRAEEPSQILGISRSAGHWLQVCVVCSAALEVCKELNVEYLHVDTEIRISASTLYGLALGYLNRFYEAHRFLNDAESSLSLLEQHQATYIGGVIELRRTEIHWLEALRLGGIYRHSRNSTGRAVDFDKVVGEIVRADPNACDVYGLDRKLGPERWIDATSRMMAAALDSASLALDRAMNCLAGRSHSSRWWWQLNQLRMHIWAAALDLDGHDLLAFRTQQDYAKRLVSAYAGARMAAQTTHYLHESVRVCARAALALYKLNRISGRDALTLGVELLRDLESAGGIESAGGRYREAVTQLFEACK